MSRVIKFRGYNSHDGKFMYGSFIDNSQSDFDCYIQNDSGHFLEVERDTVGQYTGLNDKNGKEIYEGDIVSEKFDNVYDVGKVVFNDGAFWVLFADDEYLLIGCDSEETEVISNIYEHPHLLEGK